MEKTVLGKFFKAVGNINKKDDETYIIPHQNSKGKVIQEAKKCFLESSLDPKKCSFIITKLLYLLRSGKVFTRKESTELFFLATRLFISNDEKLIRMLCLLIKELSRHADNSFVVTNSLYKEMNGGKGEDSKSNAIRALKTITDESTFSQLERHLKESIVDKNPSVASAAIVAGIQLSDNNLEMIKRWNREIQSTLTTSNIMVQYHAVALLYKLRKDDPLAVSKLITNNTNTFRSPLAHTLLIKYSFQVLKNGNKNKKTDHSRSILKYLNSCLTYNNNMIVLEAAKTLCNLPFLTENEIIAPIKALKSFLVIGNSLHQFAAVRILSKLANRLPNSVSICNNELEDLIQNNNKTIATNAITTLLKTGNEKNIDELLNKIEGFIHQIEDENKIVVIKAVTDLCIKYPTKYNQIIKFLSFALKEEGGYNYKKIIVDSFITILSSIKDSREFGVLQLCEFIEDCEYVLILTQILHFLGVVGPSLNQPQKCIRYIYNRVNLETAPVRAASVIALSKFGASVKSLRNSIITILKRTLNDSDDEVRDRALFYLRILQSQDEQMINDLIIKECPLNTTNVEKFSIDYLKKKNFSDFFDVMKVPLEDQIQKNKNEKNKNKKNQNKQDDDNDNDEDDEQYDNDEMFEGMKNKKSKKDKKTKSQFDGSALLKIPSLSKLGKPFNISKPTPLTELDSDYIVKCVKYVFKENIVFQFLCTNNIKNQILYNVSIEMDLDNDIEGLEEDFVVEVLKLPYKQTKSVFVCLKRNDENVLTTGIIPIILRYKVLEIEDGDEPLDEDDLDEDDLEEDEIDCDDLNLVFGDYCREKQAEFRKDWEVFGTENESSISVKVFSKNKSITSALNSIIRSLGITPINKNKNAGKKQRSLYFSCELITGDQALIVVILNEEGKRVVSMKSAVRSTNQNLRETLLKKISNKE